MRMWGMLFLCLAAVFVAVAVGGVFTSQSVGTWYPTLRKPSWNPPAWVFGPVWTILYVLMAVAAWLVWRRAGWIGGRMALTAFFGQLALNVAWSAIFFGLRNPGAAFAEIVPLWGAIAVTLVLFWRVSVPAGALLIPYLAWVSFAAALNFAIWSLNAS